LMSIGALLVTKTFFLKILVMIISLVIGGGSIGPLTLVNYK